MCSTEINDNWFTIVAEVPLNNMFGYTTELRSSTQGKGEFTMEYAKYNPCLREVQEQIIAQYQESQGITPLAQKSKKSNR
jgi:elongation factor G